MAKKKLYQKPCINLIKLVPEEAVLVACKTGGKAQDPCWDHSAKGAYPCKLAGS